MDNLTIKDVRAIANTRFDNAYLKKSKRVIFIVALAACLLIGLCLSLTCYNSYNVESSMYKNSNGETISVNSLDKFIMVGDDVYLKDSADVLEPEQNVGYYLGLGLVVLVLLGVCQLVIFYGYQVETFKDRFVQYWVDKKEFLDVN